MLKSTNLKNSLVALGALTLMSTVSFAQNLVNLNNLSKYGVQEMKTNTLKKGNQTQNINSNAKTSAACSGTFLLNESFVNGMPTDFVLVDNDGLTPHSSVATNFTDAWNVVLSGGDTVAASTSYYTPAGQSDDWMITSMVTLGANSCLSFNARALDANFRDGYEVKLSTTDTLIASFTNTLLSVSAENSTWTEHVIDLTNFAGEDVYIAFVNNSNDMFILAIDDIKITNPANLDVALSSINAPVETGCLLSENAQVNVTVTNAGTDSLENVIVSYSVDNFVIDTDTIASIAPGAAVNHIFSETYDFSLAGTYVLSSEATVAGETNTSNNIFTVDLISAGPSTAPYAMGFESSEDFSNWSSIDVNADGTRFATSTTNVPTGAVCMRLGPGATANDFLITNCIELDATKTYSLALIHRNFDPAGPNNLILKMGSEPTAAGLTDIIADLGSLDENNVNVVSSTVFNVSTSGIYYIGFHILNTAGSGAIRLDDVAITEVTGTKNLLNNKNLVKIYPNPASDVVNINLGGEESTISIINTLGQVVYSAKNVTEINTSNLAEGTYTVKIQTEKSVITEKINIVR